MEVQRINKGVATMKKLLFAMLLATVLIAQASPARAQYYGSDIDLLNFIKTKIDSIATLLSAPPPVTCHEQEIFSGLNMIDSTLQFWVGKRTYPYAGAPNVDGARAILVCFDWTTYVNGGFTLYNVWASTPIDTACFSAIAFPGYNGTVLTTAHVDTINCDDSTGVFVGVRRYLGSATILLPVPAGAGYYFSKLQPHGVKGENCHIHGLNERVRVVK
jgi:hypothetical protein